MYTVVNYTGKQTIRADGFFMYARGAVFYKRVFLFWKVCVAFVDYVESITE